MRINPAASATRPSGDSNRISLGSVVEYEQHGKPYLAIVLDERKGTYAVVNERGQELSLSPDRIFLLPLRLEVAPHQRQSSIQALHDLLQVTAAKVREIDLEAIWSLLKEEKRELSERSIAELVFPGSFAVNALPANDQTAELLAIRRSLLEDTVFFKRRKTGYEARPAEVVEELKRKAEADAVRGTEREAFKAEILKCLKGEGTGLGRNWGSFGISDLEHLASEGSQSQTAKETIEFIEELNEANKLGLTGKPQEKAFQLLVRAGHFSKDQDLNLIRSGRPVHFTPAVEEELQSLLASWKQSQATLTAKKILSVTIDGEATRDIDDALSLEEVPGGYLIGIHISDVANVVPPRSKLEEQALRRATSMYTPDYQLPMFPPELSEGALSLIEGEIRRVMSFYIETDKQFEITSTRVEVEPLKISKRLSYTEADKILVGDAHTEPPLEQMLLRLWDAASAFESMRIQDGALQFPRREMFPHVTAAGIVTLERTEEETPARKLVSEMMIAANFVAATYAKNNGVALSFRSQEGPDCDILASGGEVPEGPAREFYFRGLMKRSVTSVNALPHSGLGVPVYAQVTSPIRRLLDLLNQRQIATHLATGAAFYTREEMQQNIDDCEARLDETNFLQRQRTRYWILRYLEQKNVGHVYGTIVRVEQQRPLVELEELLAIMPFQPSKPVGDFSDRANSRLGERVKLRLQKLNARDDRLLLVEEAS